MRIAARGTAAVAVALLVAGCGQLSVGLSVGPAAPRPNVMIAAGNVPAALILAPAIPDQFVVPKTGSVGDVSVRGWRKTLTAGYQSAFPGAGGPGRQLELLSAELSFGPAAVSQAGTVAVVAMIRFKARVVDASGNELASFAGTVQAREANTSTSEDGMTDNAAKAVEALYETLARELLSRS